MFHVKLIPFLLIPIFIHSISVAQGSIELEDKPFTVTGNPDQKIQDWLSGFSIYKKMTPFERDVMYWVNVMRSNPSDFNDKYVRAFLSQFPEAESRYSKSLAADLKGSPALPLFKPTEILYSASVAHARDLALKQKRLSHSSSSGEDFLARVKKAGIKGCAAENLYEGKDDALKAIILLLIDQNVPDLGHRKSLLDPRLNLMSPGSQPKGNKFILVQLFSCE
jgi:hypothetical protein